MHSSVSWLVRRPAPPWLSSNLRSLRKDERVCSWLDRLPCGFVPFGSARAPVRCPGGVRWLGSFPRSACRTSTAQLVSNENGCLTRETFATALHFFRESGLASIAAMAKVSERSSDIAPSRETRVGAATTRRRFSRPLHPRLVLGVTRLQTRRAFAPRSARSLIYVSRPLGTTLCAVGWGAPVAAATVRRSRTCCRCGCSTSLTSTATVRST